MKIQTALAILRTLDTLPEARRKHLCALAVAALTDADRARIVLEARAECRRVSANLERDLRAELDARAQSASSAPPKPSNTPQGPSRRRYVMAEGVRFPAPRAVAVRYVEPTKTATEAQQSERRPLMGKNRVYEKETPEPKAEPLREPKPTFIPEHGTLTRYQKPHYCRCARCRRAKSESNARHTARRAERSRNSPT